MNRRSRLDVGLGAIALVAMLALAAPGVALAAEPAGKDIGGLLMGIAGPIVWSLGGLTALGAYLRRDVGIAFTTLLITMILGLFVTEEGQGALQALSNLLKDALPTG